MEIRLFAYLSDCSNACDRLRVNNTASEVACLLSKNSLEIFSFARTENSYINTLNVIVLLHTHRMCREVSSNCVNL